MTVSSNEAAYEQLHIGDDAAKSIIITITFCFVVASVAVSLRVTARRLRRLPLLTDDWLAMTSLVFAAGLVANVIVDVYGGLGRHLIMAKHPIIFAKSFIAGETLYVVTVVPIKLSLVFLYRRIFPTRSLLIALWVVGTLVVIMGIMGIFLAVFYCVPIQASWDPTISAHCINFRAAIIFHGTQNVILDFVILFLPMPLVWRLQMPTSKKVQVSGIFILGGFASIASIVRLKYLSRVSLVDATWYDVAPTIWSMIEVCMGITACCLPTLGPIVSYALYGRAAAQGRVQGPRFDSDDFVHRDANPKQKISVSTTSWPESEARTQSLTRTVSHFSSYGSTPEHRRSKKYPLSKLLRSSPSSRKQSIGFDHTKTFAGRNTFPPKKVFAGHQYWKPLPPPPFAQITRVRAASALEMAAISRSHHKGVGDAEAGLAKSNVTINNE